MGLESTSAAPAGLFEEFRQELASVLNKGVSLLETEQSKINKAFFEALTMEQRDKFCQSLAQQGVKASRQEGITGKSQTTVNRHNNGRNS